uniref:Uncharacterized protein n=1 Tax=Anguilla anguilla TaxID=7936 RepID=A0A0E9P813_ANGAN
MQHQNKSLEWIEQSSEICHVFLLDKVSPNVPKTSPNGTKPLQIRILCISIFSQPYYTSRGYFH